MAYPYLNSPRPSVSGKSRQFHVFVDSESVVVPPRRGIMTVLKALLGPFNLCLGLNNLS